MSTENGQCHNVSQPRSAHWSSIIPSIVDDSGALCTEAAVCGAAACFYVLSGEWSVRRLCFTIHPLTLHLCK